LIDLVGVDAVARLEVTMIAWVVLISPGYVLKLLVGVKTMILELNDMEGFLRESWFFEICNDVSSTTI